MVGIAQVFPDGFPYHLFPIPRKGKALIERLKSKNLYEEDEDFPGDPEEPSSTMFQKYFYGVVSSFEQTLGLISFYNQNLPDLIEYCHRIDNF